MNNILKQKWLVTLSLSFFIAVPLKVSADTGPDTEEQQEVLDEFDKDGDGRINAKERFAMKSLNPAERRKRENQEKLLKRFDADNDGKLNDSERKKAYSTVRTERRKIEKQVLKKFDANNNGRIDKKKERRRADAWIKMHYPDAIFLPGHDKKNIKKKEARVAAGNARRGAMTEIPERSYSQPSSTWLPQVHGYELPQWYQQANRIHGHTRLTALRPTNHVDQKFAGTRLAWLGTDEFDNAGKYFSEMGVEVFSRHVRTGDEGAWWPSKVGDVLDVAKERNIAQEIIDEAHKNGQRIIVYNRHMEDHGIAQAHPEWVARNEEGKAYIRRGKMICFNSPYREHVQKRLLELVDMGVDGFYFDSGHQPYSCHCSYCKEKGKHRGQIIRDTFLQFRKAIHERNPEVVVLISGRFEGESHDLWRIPDSPKIEPHLIPKYGNKGDFGTSLGLTFIRDAADGKPAHNWRNNKSPVNDKEALWSLAFGHIFNYDVAEVHLANPESQRFKTGKSFTPYGATFAEHLAGKKPLRSAIVHYPEGMPDGMKETPLVLPYFKEVYQHQIPTGIILDSQLREGIPAETQLLVFPDPSQAPLQEPGVIKHLGAFKARGGRVVMGPLSETAKAEIAKIRAQAPFYLEEDSGHIHMTAFQNAGASELSVVLLNTSDAGAASSKLYLSEGFSDQSFTDTQTGSKLPVKKDRQGAYIDIDPFRYFQILSISL